jgi:hypothetical protein
MHFSSEQRPYVQMFGRNTALGSPVIDPFRSVLLAVRSSDSSPCVSQGVTINSSVRYMTTCRFDLKMNSEERTSRIVQTPACSILQHPADIPAAPSQRRVSFPLVGIRYVSRKCLGSAVFPWPSEHNNVRTCLRCPPLRQSKFRCSLCGRQ